MSHAAAPALAARGSVPGAGGGSADRRIGFGSGLNPLWERGEVRTEARLLDSKNFLTQDSFCVVVSCLLVGCVQVKRILTLETQKKNDRVTPWFLMIRGEK